MEAPVASACWCLGGDQQAALKPDFRGESDKGAASFRGRALVLSGMVHKQRKGGTGGSPVNVQQKQESDETTEIRTC